MGKHDGRVFALGDHQARLVIGGVYEMGESPAFQLQHAREGMEIL